MALNREELLRVAAMIYGNRDYKGKPLSVEDAVEEAAELIRKVDEEIAADQATDGTA